MKLRVLYLIPSLVQGGAQRHLLEVHRELDRTRFDPAICSVLEGMYFTGDTTSDEPRFPLHRRFGFSPFTLTGIARVLRTFDPHILHCHLNDANLWGRLAARLAGFRGAVMTSVHLADMGLGYRVLERRLYALSTVVVAHSLSIERFLLERVGVPKEKLIVVANGVDPSRFTPGGDAERAAARQTFGFPPDVFIGLMPARISRQKNQDLMVEAMGRLRSQGRLPAHFRLVLAGNISTRAVANRVDALIAQHQLADQVVRPGAVRDIAAMYRASDCVLMPSRVEGLPLAGLEAMAMELPLLISDAANAHQVAVPGQHGWEVPVGDVDALANALAEVIATPRARLREMGRAGRQHVLAHFTSARVTREFEAAYQRFAPSRDA